MKSRLALAALAALALLASACGGESDPIMEWVNHNEVSMHIHPHLTLRVEGKQVVLPANIGIPSGERMRPIHTHDDSGTLHIEYRRYHEFTLGDFFRVWEDNPYAKRPVTQVFVDNQKYDGDYTKILLRDRQRIVLHLGPEK